MKNYKLLLIVFLLFSLSTVLAQTSSNPIVINKGLGISFTQNGKKLSMNQLIAVTKTNPNASKEIQIAKVNRDMSQLFGLPGGFLLGFSLGKAMVTGEANTLLIGLGGALIIASIPFSSAYSKHAKKGVNIYNENLNATTLGKIDFNVGLTQHGIGLSMNF